MALTLNGASSKLVGSNLATAYPISMFCWIRPNNIADAQCVIGCGDNGGASEIAMLANGNITGDPTRAFERAADTTNTTAESASSMSVGTWQPCLVVFRSATSRSVYFADGAMVTDNTSKTADFANFDRFVIGTRPISDSLWADMDVAHAAIWSYKLQEDDWLNLKAGVVPDQVQPDDLIDYWALTTSAATQTGVNGNVLTATNTSTAGTSPTMAGTFDDSGIVRNDGAWTWFTEPRAVYYNGATYIGWVSKNGSIGISKYVHSTGARTYYMLYETLEQDDHNNPSVYIRTDGKIICFYSKHTDTSGIRYRISTNAEDITAWGTEQTIPANGTWSSYNNPRYLSSNSRLYLHYRDSNQSQYQTYSDDNGATWLATHEQLVVNGTERPYVKSISNGTDRIDYYITQGHPGEVISDLYHFMAKIVGGVIKYYKSDGTTELTLPVNPTTDLTPIYDASANGNVSGWQWDCKRDGSGYPRVLFIRIVSSSDLRYCFTRWNGSAWTTPVEITTAGAIIASGTNYAGGMCFSYNDVDKIYLGKEASGVCEIEEWTTSDSGATWSKSRDVTTAGVKSARPYAPLNADPGMSLLWWSGTYTGWTSWDTDIHYEASAYSVYIDATSYSSSFSAPTLDRTRVANLSATSYSTAFNTVTLLYSGTGSATIDIDAASYGHTHANPVLGWARKQPVSSTSYATTFSTVDLTVNSSAYSLPVTAQSCLTEFASVTLDYQAVSSWTVISPSGQVWTVQVSS